MATHKAQFGWISRTQKTVKAECGKRVSCSLIAINADADCPECRAAVDKDYKGMDAIIAICKERDSKQAAKVQASRDESHPKRYQTIYFL